MKGFEQVLIDCERPALEQALAEAAAPAPVAAGKKPKKGVPWPPPEFETFLAEMSRAPSGSRRWEGKSRAEVTLSAGVAWWTDPRGRRHYRVRADDVPPNWPENNLLFGNDDRVTDLFRVYPEAGVLRTFPGQRCEIVFCPCGRSGTPAEVGWSGTHCGSCSEPRGEPAAHWPGQCSLNPRAPTRISLGGAAFAPDGKTLAAITYSATATLAWNAVPSLERRKKTVKYNSNDRRVAGYTRDGRLLLISQYFGVWACEGKTGDELAHWDFAGDTASGVAVGAGGERVLAARISGLYTWRPGEGQGQQLSADRFARVTCSPDGRHLAALGFRTGRLVLLDADNGAELGRLDVDVDADYRFAFSPDGRMLAVAVGGPSRHECRHDPGTVLLCTVPDVQVWATLPAAGLTDDPNPFFSPDGRWLLTWGRSGLVRFYDAASGAMVAALTWPGAVGEVAPLWSPDGSMVLIADSWSGRARIWPWDFFQQAVSSHVPAGS